MSVEAFTLSPAALSGLPFRHTAQAGRRAAPAPAAFPLFEDIRGEYISAAVVDRDMGFVLTPGGEEAMEAEAKSYAAVLDAAAEAADWLTPGDEVLEIQVSTRNQVHVIRPIDEEGRMYLYASLDKDKGRHPDTAQMRMRMIELAFGI